MQNPKNQNGDILVAHCKNILKGKKKYIAHNP